MDDELSGRGLINLSSDEKEEEEKKDNSELRVVSTLFDNKLMPGEETKTISHAQQSMEPQPEHAHHEPFDEEVFMNLDEKIRAGEITDAEEDTYAKLVPQKVKQQVLDYERSPEELQQILEEHETKFGLDRDCTIKTVEHFIDKVSETSQLDVDHLWTYTDHGCDIGDEYD